MLKMIKQGIKFYLMTPLFFFSFPVFSQWQLENKLIDVLTVTNNKNKQLPNYFYENNKKNIDEIGFVLYDLVRKKDFTNIDIILKKYINDKQHDKNLVKFIYAEKEMLKNNYDTTIILYHEILIEKPNILLVELKLALVFIKVKRYQDALLVYTKVLAKYENKLPIDLINFIHHQIAQLKKKNTWHGMIKFGSSYDSNLNEASNSDAMHCFHQTCMSSGNRSIAGGKWNYTLELSKRYPLFKQHSGQLSFGTLGLEPMKSITNRRNTVFINAGYQYEDENKKIDLLPTVEAKWCDNQYRNVNLGVKSTMEYALTNQVILLGYLSLENKNYVSEYTFNDGGKFTYSLIGLYTKNADLMFFGGLHGVNRNKEYVSDSYLQHGIKVGVLKTVGPFEFLVSAGYKNTQFKGFDKHLNVKRKDNNWYVNTQLKFDGKNVFNFTPSIYFNNQLNKSTADVIYSFKQSEVGVNFTKKF